MHLYICFSGQLGCWDSQAGVQGGFKEVQEGLREGEGVGQQLAGEVGHQVAFEELHHVKRSSNLVVVTKAII